MRYKQPSKNHHMNMSNTTNSLVQKLGAQCLKIFFYALDLIVPKKYQLVFCSKVHRQPNQNTFLLFRKAQDLGMPAVFVSDQAALLQEVPGIVPSSGWACFWLVLRAKYVFLSHGPGDIPWAWFSRRKVVCYVGHGIPLKTFMLKNKALKGIEYWRYRLEIASYTYVVASSTCDQRNLARCFRKPLSQVLVTGLPRNDDLESRKDYLRTRFPGKTIILYAPTVRDQPDYRLLPFDDLDLSSLDKFLAQHEMVLLLRHHVNNANVLEVSALDHVFALPNEEVAEIQPHLAAIDVLITDYSSIYFDFLLLQRPVFFIPYDFPQYSHARGLLYTYDEVTPGPHILIQKQLLEELKLLPRFMDRFGGQYQTVRSQFQAYDDKANCQRLLITVIREYDSEDQNFVRQQVKP